ncbi:MAG: hypothetical protein DRP18_05310 [Candidatus Aenigmatarchaeota archaeon]|nr:MAG: hypothetical protein DRP18_05310 [Candidatus Aenigmarchaeota archaeon]RLJ08001.1 MAG: hypothetical protein DRP16_02340 [Candidatus Aenigmarchaeota archaeon]
MDFEEMREKTLETLEKLKKSGAKDWEPEVRFIQLVEEIGELANALLAENGHKPQKTKIFDLGDSFADVLFNLIILADKTGTDLEKEYEKMLKSLEKRIKKGEFKD